MDLPEQLPDPHPGNLDPAGTPPILLLSRGRAAGEMIAQALSAHSRIVPVDGLDALARSLDARPEARAVALYETAAEALEADELSGGRDGDGDLARVLDGWAADMQELLTLQGRNRRRMLLIEARAVLFYPEVFATRLGLPATAAAALAALPRQEPDPVVQALLEASLQGDAGLRRVSAMVRAVTLDLSNKGPRPGLGLDGAVAHYRALRLRSDAADTELEQRRQDETALRAELEQAQQAIATLEPLRAELDHQKAQTAETVQERDRLQGWLQNIQSDLEQQYQRRQEAEAEVDRRRQAETALRAELEQARKTIATLEPLRAELDRQKAQTTETARDRDGLRERLQAVQSKLEEAQQTITALEPLRAELDRLKGQAAETTRDRDGLRSRFQNIQSDLEQQYQGRQTAETELVEARDRLARLEAEAAEKAKQITELTQSRDTLSTRLGEAEFWIQGIKASKSYRIMAPARRLRAAFKRKE